MELDWRARKIIDNLWGPGGSILLHIIVLVVLFNVVMTSSPKSSSEVEVVIKEVESFEELDEIEEELDELEDIPTVVDAVAPPSVSLDQEPPQVDAMTSAGEAVDMSEFNMMEAVSPLKFRGLYASRSSGGQKDGLRKYGGGMGKSTEYAVKKALEWLKNHQEPKGSWGPHYRVAMTSMALLAFFAHGETTGSEDYGFAIQKGLKYLLSTQKNGMFIAGGPVRPVTRVRCYEHGVGTYAISEAYGLTSIPFLKFAMEDAIQVIIDGQHEGGSWDYGYVKGPKAHVDTSLAGWHIQALEAGLMAGAENMGLKSAIDSAMRGLKAMTGHKELSSMFAYSTREEHKAADMVMTGVAVLCMQLTGHAMDSESRNGLKALQSLRFQWQKGAADQARGVGSWPIYAWYYITQARFHHGGATWASWNRQFAPALCRMQNPDGSWCPAPASVETGYGPVYCTALSCLMLEVYYRFLPTFQEIKVDTGTQMLDDETDEEDIVIKFG